MKRSRLNPVSSKERRRKAAWPVVREQVMSDAGWRCQWDSGTWNGWDHTWCDDRCGRRADHAHHMLRRSQGGPDTPVNLMAVCDFHHRMIHDRPEQAYAAGYLVRATGPAPVEKATR